MTSSCRRRVLWRDERGDIVLSWLTRVSLVLAVLGVVSFDAISVGATSVMLADQGRTAAREASSAWQATPDARNAYTVAADAATTQNPDNVIDPASFTVDRDGTVHLRITREASTLVARRVPPLRRYLTITRTESARSIVS
ncbi:MAG: hypothetical protein M3P48_11130 [Actinomycetota bacterium]|nr:hypothetical protein [Actinomycetota bacterium]